ncbi:hypothetical protein ASG11_17730 [Sphingomonas sp. Leaf357]|uniref:hypothetical protein n=1 Tax=Sphingomonas sp. Leaf357 TaxID=1736350 RepID=UPI0006F9EC85|nr:hypothetical protein [Sphingomonas sp. Leaf357]KQS01494.1 hypothetical protein ASG11_17730 [Sphingomonas sp. Leaf357]
MHTQIAQKALHIATTSPFPQSFDGSGTLFWFALFSLTVIPSLAIMLGGMLATHLYEDRELGIDAAAALRALVLAVCVTATMRCVPEVASMISYGEAAPATLQTILSVKRVFDSVSLVPVLFWMATFWVYYPEILLRLRSPSSVVWQDHKLASLKRFISVVILAAALAGSVTLGMAFR